MKFSEPGMRVGRGLRSAVQPVCIADPVCTVHIDPAPLVGILIFIHVLIRNAQDIQTDVSNGRFDLWESGIEIWKTKPVTGTGYNSFLPYVEETLPDTYVVNNDQGNYVSLHNGYLNILVYQGILGAAISLVFIGGVLWNWCRGIKRVPRKDSLYITFLTAVIVVIAVSMLFLLEGVYTNSPGTFILWNFLGYLMHYFSNQAEEKR